MVQEGIGTLHSPRLDAGTLQDLSVTSHITGCMLPFFVRHTHASHHAASLVYTVVLLLLGTVKDDKTGEPKRDETFHSNS